MCPVSKVKRVVCANIIAALLSHSHLAQSSGPHLDMEADTVFWSGGECHECLENSADRGHMIAIV